MWEFCIEASIENGYILKFLKQKLCESLKKFGGISAVVNTDNKSILVIACRKEFQKEFEKELRLFLCDAICDEFKFKFFKNNINLCFGNKKMLDAFLKVYTYFDQELERQIVLRQLFFSEKLVFESFFNFRLSLLKQKWLEMCELVNSNNSLLIKSETFLELLKFLVSNLEIKTNAVILDCFDDYKIYIENDDGNLKLDSCHQDCIKTIISIIKLCPQKIKVLLNKKNDDIIGLLYELFGNRLEIIKNF